MPNAYPKEGLPTPVLLGQLEQEPLKITPSIQVSDSLIFEPTGLHYFHLLSRSFVAVELKNVAYRSVCCELSYYMDHILDS